MAKKFFNGQTPRFQDITGFRSGWLTVVKFHHRRNYTTYWTCKCLCGASSVVEGSNLRGRHTVSCGCWQKIRASFVNSTHGYSRPSATHTAYGSWSNLMFRCRSETFPYAHRYRLRGIKVCERWKSSQLFLDDMLPTWRPRLSIDRINNDGNYSCGKCDECKRNGWPMNGRWGTGRQQVLNSSHARWITWKGEKRCTAEWADMLGITRPALCLRLKAGWSVDRALSTPMRSQSNRKNPLSFRPFFGAGVIK